VCAQVEIIPFVVDELKRKHRLGSLSRIFFKRKHRARDCTTNFFRASLKAVLRAPIAVVILALLATPLALLARARACESASCTVMCCLPHSSHSQAGVGMACHCSTKSGKQLPDFGRIAPIAPTTPEEFASVDAPDRSRQPLRSLSPSIAQGFASTPFNPPKA
jgi:hypothetical protein